MAWPSMFKIATGWFIAHWVAISITICQRWIWRRVTAFLISIRRPDQTPNPAAARLAGGGDFRDPPPANRTATDRPTQSLNKKSPRFLTKPGAFVVQPGG